MKEYITTQRTLHRKALQIIYEIESFRGLFMNIDKKYMDEKVAEKMEEYQILMNELKITQHETVKDPG